MKVKTKKAIKNNIIKFTKKFLYRFASRLLELSALIAIGYALGLHLVRY